MNTSRFERDYWDHRYSSGGTSGCGSVGKPKEWKWRIIEESVPNISGSKVLDVGCGDLSFWDGRDCDSYVGIDFSKTVIEKNKKKRRKWHFIQANAEDFIPRLEMDVVFCFDVLFHIMDTDRFRAILHNLCRYSGRFIFIHTWWNNPFDRRKRIEKLANKILQLRIRSALYVAYDLLRYREKVTDKEYVYYRSLLGYMNIFREHRFSLIRIELNPDHMGALYIFRKSMKPAIFLGGSEKSYALHTIESMQ